MKIFLHLLREFLSEQLSQTRNYLQENMPNPGYDEYAVIRIRANK